MTAKNIHKPIIVNAGPGLGLRIYGVQIENQKAETHRYRQCGSRPRVEELRLQVDNQKQKRNVIDNAGPAIGLII